MTITDQADRTDTGFGGPGLGLSTERAVERGLVHRHAVAEVFVTDSAEAGEDRYVVAAQLPRAHAYFNDHLVRPAVIDPLLLLECVRQTGTVVAHRHLGVELDTSFLITHWDTRLADAASLAPREDGPDQLEVAVEAHDLKRRKGRLLSARLVAELYVGGRPVGSSSVAAGYLPREDYKGYRTLRRSSPPPLSVAMPRPRAGTPVDPGAVGRRLTENVVLAGGRRSPGKAMAELDAPVTHPALYDHPLDHVPAMALLEAARQAALFAAGADVAAGAGAAAGDVPAVSWFTANIDARFHRFVEHDAPTTVTARARARARDEDVRRVVAVEFEQAGAVACAVEVTLARPGGDQAGSDEARSAEAGSAEAGSAEAGSDEAGSDEAGSDEAGSDEG